MKFKQIIAGFFIISAGYLTACKPQDANLKSDVSEAIKNDKVDVSVKDGVVTLKGEVDDPAEKAVAESQAKTVEGVNSVVNEITIPLPPPPPDAPVVVVEDDDALQAHVNVAIAPFKDVRASVNGGVVTLTGEIRRPDLLVLMPAIAVLHPKDIKNNLKIK